MDAAFPFIKGLSKQPSPEVLVNFPGWIQILSNLCHEIQSSTKFVTFITEKTVEYRIAFSILVQVFKALQGGRGENSFISNVPVSGEDFELMKNEAAKDESFILEDHQLSQVQSSSVSTVVNNSMEETAGTYLLNLRVYLSSLSDKIQDVLELENAPKDSGVDVPYDSGLKNLRKLKMKLCDVLDKLDTELLDLVVHPDQSKRENKWDDLISKKEEITDIISDLSYTVIRKHLGGFHSLGFCDYLADIIGLRRDVVRKILEKKSIFLQNHYGIEELIHLYLDGVSQDDANEETYEDQLRGFGFTENRARYLGSKIRGYSWEDRHISVLEFAHCFIEDIFKYDVLLNEDVTRVPNGSSGDNVPNKMKCFVNDKQQKDVSIFNVFKNAATGSRPGKNQVDFSTTDLDTKPENDFEHWFHGTDLYAALDICRYGIDVDKGKPGKDFSDGRGFYLSDTYKPAVEYTEKFTTPATAVLRYNIPKEFFSKHRGIELSRNDSEDMQKWKEVVRHFRSGKKEGSPELKQEIKTAQYIKGPLSHDGKWNKKNKENENWPQPFDIPWSQLCIQKRSTAEELNQYLDSVLFIQLGRGPTTQGNEIAVKA